MSPRKSIGFISIQNNVQNGRGLRTDSSPSFRHSLSSKPSSSSKSQSLVSSSESSKSSSSSATPLSNSTILNVPYNETTPSTVPPRLLWDREAPAVYRPYDFRDFDVAFKAIPAYHSQLGGLDASTRKPCHRPKPDPFHKRTHIDEIYHKRVTDASAFAITERLPEVCEKLKPPEMGEIKLKAVDSVVLADNVDLEKEESTASELEEDLCELSWEEFQKIPKRDDVLRECKRTFFRARKELFKSRQYEDYQLEKNRRPVEVESWELSSDSTLDEEQVLPAEPEEIIVPINECKTLDVVHEEDKTRVQEHEQSYMERVRKYMWDRYEREEKAEQEAQAERDKSPEPLDEELILKNLPKQDYLNVGQHEFRKKLAERLEELNECVALKPMNLPKTKVQFEKYNDRLMSARRELRDEAILVDEHYKSAGLEIDVPEKDLQLIKKYRAIDYKSDEEASVVDDEDEAPEPVVHTCMTRLEWSRWLGHYTKHEKLNLPVVKIPRLPKLVHPAAEESPIRMYIKGLHREDELKKKTEMKQKKLSPVVTSSVEMVKKSTKKPTLGWHLDEVLYEKTQVSSDPYLTPYQARFRPVAELVDDRFKLVQARNRKRRDLRKNHMTWINQVVEEICSRNYR